MIFKTESEFVKHIKAKQPLKAYLLYGSQRYLIELYFKQLARSDKDAFDDFNLQVFDGKKLSADELSDAVEALPLMSSSKTVIIDDLDIDKLPADESKKLYEILSDLPDTCKLVITVKSSELNPKRSSKAKKLIEAVDKCGAVIELSSRTKSDMIKYLCDTAEKSGCQMPAGVAEHMLERCGEDMQILKNELAKLTAYANKSAITIAMVDDVTTAIIDASVFDISKAIMRADYSAAMNIISDLLYLKEPPTAIIAAISMSFIDLYRAKTAKCCGADINDAIDAFGYKGKDFRIKNAMRDQHRFTVDFLRGSLEILARADYRLKSSRTEDRIVVEQAIAEIFMLYSQK